MAGPQPRLRCATAICWRLAQFDCTVRFALEKPVDDALLESLRIQAAAVAAQQSALTELEIRLADRETSLVRQENQLATHLETQRRQLLELQDQITVARASLRKNGPPSSRSRPSRNSNSPPHGAGLTSGRVVSEPERNDSCVFGAYSKAEYGGNERI